MSPNWPLWRLTVSATAKREGLSNQPESAAHRRNLEHLSHFLDRVPFDIGVNSAYRSNLVNIAVDGAKSSQHKEGLGADLDPRDPRLGADKSPGGANKALARRFYEHQAEFPELDQVIWYRDKRHTHVGICPPGAPGCASGAPRAQFLVHSSTGYKRARFAPSRGEDGGGMGLVALLTIVAAIGGAVAISRS